MIPVQFQTTETSSGSRSTIRGSNWSDQLEKGLPSQPSTENPSQSSSAASSSSPSDEVRPWTDAWFHITVSVLSAPAAASLPYAFAYLTWPGALLLLAFATITSYASGQMLINLQNVPHMKTYSDVADAAMDRPGFANRWVRPFQALVFVQVSIWTILVTGQAMANLDSELSPTGQQHLSDTLWVVMSGLLYFLIAMIPSLDKMWSLSVVGSFCGVVACVLLVAGSAVAISNGSRSNIDFDRPPSGGTDLTYAFGILASFGTIALTYGGHSVLPDLQSSLHEPDATKAKAAMNQALKAAFAIIAPSYLAVSVVGYAAFGSAVQPYLVDSLIANFNGKYSAYLIVLNFCIVINQFFEGSIYVQAAFTLMGDIFETFVGRTEEEEKEEEHRPFHRRGLGFLELVARLVYVAFCTFIAIAIPFFGDLTSLTGSLGFIPMTFVFPFVFWLYSSSGGKDARQWKRLLVGGVAVTFVLMGIGGAIAAIYFIVQQSQTFRFFG